MHVDNTSGVKGVWWHKQIEKWCAEYVTKGIKHYLGCFDTLKEAKKALMRRGR